MAKGIDWGWQKAGLLFVGLLTKGLAMGDPLPVEYGVLIKQVCGVAWMAFDGSFIYLLKPPAQQRPQEEQVDG